MPLPSRGSFFIRLQAINVQPSRVSEEASKMKGKYPFPSQNVALVLDSQQRPAVIQSFPP